MEYVNLGRAGVKVSRICLGCMSFGNARWMIELDESRNVFKKAIDLGINFFDTANVYSSGRSEEITGECLKGYREDMVVATKVYSPVGDKPNQSGLSRRHITAQIHASLKRLKMDYIDLYQIHHWDSYTPIEETLRTLNDIVRAGKARYIGASNTYAWQFLRALCTSDRLGLEKFVSMQNHYNLTYREEEREMIPLCQEQGIAIVPYSPLARGFLTGKYKRGVTPTTPRFLDDVRLKARYFKPEDFDVAETVEALAKDKRVKPGQIALAWLLHKPYVTSPIIGATRTEQVEEAVDSMSIKLDAKEIERLEQCYKPHPAGVW